MIISNKNGIYELPQQLPNKLRLRILGNNEILGKSQNCMKAEPSTQLFSQNQNLSILVKYY